MGKRKTIFIFSVLFPIVASSCGSKENAPSTKEKFAVIVKTQPAKKETRTLQRRYTGYTHPADASGVGFMVAGRVTSILVDEGDEVKAGRLLATMNAKDYALMKKLSEIQVGTLAPNVERLQNLVDKKVLPQSQLDTLEGQYQAAVTQQQQAKRQLTYTKLRSPINGTVHEIMTAEGQVIAPGMPVVALLDLSSIEVKIGVSQPDLSLFPKGAVFDVSVAGIQKTFTASVTHVDLVADVQTRTFSVTLVIDNKEKLLRPSMTASLNVITKQAQGIFAPLYAVGENADGGPIVKLMDKNTRTVKEKDVKLGNVFGEEVEVTGGLQEGDLLIVRGQEFVKDGQKVNVK